MLVALLLCIIFCACAVLVGRARAREVCGHALPPAYPGALPLIGHAHLLLTDNERLWELVQTMAYESLRHGGLIFGYIGREIYYIITDPDDALTASNSCLQKHYAYGYAKAWLGDGLITGSGETWKRHRKLLNPAFSAPVVHGFLEVFNSQSRKLVIDTEPHVGRGQFDIFTYFRNISMESFCLAAFGIGGVDKDFVQKYIKATDEILNLLTSRFYHFYLQSDLIYKLSGLKKKEAEIISVLNTMTTKVMQRKKEAMKNGENIENESQINSSGRYKPFLDLLLSLDGTLTDQEIREEIDTAIMAGFDTTSLELLYTTVMMGSYPKVQERVYEELIAVLGPDRDVEKDDLNRLLYTEAVIKETVRYIPGAPVLLRYVDKDVKLKNYTMRAGSQCAIMPVGTHRHAVWGADNKEFRPERWLDAASMPDKVNAFGGFSWGKRSCIGKTYALATLKVTLAHFLRQYRVKSDVSKMKFKLDFILKPLSGYDISIEKRN